MKPHRQNYPNKELFPEEASQDPQAVIKESSAELLAYQKTQPGAKAGTYMSNAAFAKKYCGMDGSTWGRVLAAFVGGTDEQGNAVAPKRSVYSVQDLSGVASSLANGVRLVRQKIQSAEQNVSLQDVVSFGCHKTVTDAITAARSQKRNRWIPVIGETGAGKSVLKEVIRQSQPNVICITASPTWKKSYAPIWRKLAEELKLKKRSIIDLLQDDVIAALKRGQFTIVIDEAQSVGSLCSEAIKYILEMSDSIVVMLTTPDQWKHVEDHNWDNVAQAENRVFTKIMLCMTNEGKPLLDPKDLQNYVTTALPQFANTPQEVRAEIIATLRLEGEHFGLWNKVAGICDQVAKVSKRELPITKASFTAAATALTTLGRK